MTFLLSATSVCVIKKYRTIYSVDGIDSYLQNRYVKVLGASKDFFLAQIGLLKFLESFLPQNKEEKFLSLCFFMRYLKAMSLTTHSEERSSILLSSIISS